MPIPAYQLKPQATDQLSQSQSDILNNFTAIQGLIDVNHAPFSDGTNYGKHKWINFPVQTGLPGSPSQFASGEVGLYNQLPTANPITGIDELFINKIVSGGAAVQVPMTASILSTNNGPGTFSNGWTYLPSGILLKWAWISGTGLEGGASNTKGVVVFPTGANTPVFRGIFQVLVSQVWQTNRTSAGSNGFALFSMSTTQFIVTWSGNNSTGSQLSYLAIGY